MQKWILSQALKLIPTLSDNSIASSQHQGEEKGFIQSTIKSLLCTKHCARSWDTTKNKSGCCWPSWSFWSIQEKGKNAYILEVHVCQGHPENKTRKHKNPYAALGTPESGMCEWVRVVSHFGISVHFHKEHRRRITIMTDFQSMENKQMQHDPMWWE